MSGLQISLFGRVQIARDEVMVSAKLTRTPQALLAYLLLQREQAHSREVLADLFWGEHSNSRSRNCLNTALWRLRCVLEPEGISRGTYLVTTPTGEVSFNWESDYWLDVAAFEAQIGQVVAQPVHSMQVADAQTLQNALQLYRGDLLEGFYDDWALRERERLRGLYLNSLLCLMRYYKHQGAYQESLTCGQQILNCDPLHEEIHRDMMRLYVASGSRTLAVRQYEICRQALARELGILPMEETQALYAQIVQMGSPSGLQFAALDGLADLQQALGQLRQTIQVVDQMRAQLQQAIQVVERWVGQETKGR